MRSMRTLELRLEQRQGPRRQLAEGETLSAHQTFDADERATFKLLERRRHLRREVDLRKALVSLER